MICQLWYVFKPDMRNLNDHCVCLLGKSGRESETVSKVSNKLLNKSNDRFNSFSNSQKFDKFSV